MGSRTQPNKLLLDIEDCVSELNRQSEDGKVPINDDSPTLHRLQETLELILLFGLIEKPGLLGPKKSYWNYICSCFASSKRSHDGINFVKSVVALKTPIGHGRALIRYCLTQKCLADTLQSCFMNQKVSRDFYTERSLPLQEKLWSPLVTSLYELNDLNFDLCAGHTELDISWPKFAWKLFATTDNENFPHRNMSTPNLHTYITQDEFKCQKQQSDSSSLGIGSSSTDNCSVILDAVKLAEINAKLSQENKVLKKEVGSLEKEKIQLQSDIETLQKKCLSLQQQLNFSEDICEIASDEAHLQEKDNLDNFSSNKCENINVESLSASTKAEDTTNILVNGREILLSPTSSPSVKSKVKNTSQNSPDCALQDRNAELPSDHLLNHDMFSKDSENYQLNRYTTQNPIYINELLIEIKTVIDDIEDTIQKSDVTLAIPHISRLKKIRNHLEDIFSPDVHKSKSYLNFSNFVENCVSCIKNFASKQENIINSLQEKIDLSIKGNHNLYTRIRTLKDLLKSYGFLRVTNEREIQPDSVLLSDNCSSVVSKFSCEDFACDIAHDPMLKRIIVPLLPVLNSTFSKLNSLNEKMVELQFGLDTSQELNNHLITRVQDQEMHLRGVTKEIEEAQQLVSVLKKQHRKLQSAEGILKYDLQEKRKLLTRLKQQLENTREDFNLVRIKNSKSEAEWQDLHKEFTQRHKQTSEESGFVDDKGFEEQETASSSASCDSNFPEESTSEKDSINKDLTEAPRLTKKARLALLEEQCQTLYSNLLKSSKRRQDIDRRLENMCKTIEKNNEQIHSDELISSDHPAENISNDSVNQAEDNCQTIMFPTEVFTNSPPTSDVGSLNSECSSCIPGICNDANSSDNSYCDSSKADSCVSFSPCNLHIGAIQHLTAEEQIKESCLLHNSFSGGASEFKESDENFSSCASSDITLNNSDLLNISHVDSILSKKKDLEESLKILEIEAEIQSEENISFSHPEELNEQICILQKDNKQLLSRVQELEKRILILTSELDRTTQQLVLSKAAKDHDVAALQFQLNIEALKYERALKEFSEQSKGLDSMKQRVTEQEKLILALEEALTEIHSDRENEKEQRWQESMSEVEEEHSRNEILLSQLEELKLYNQKDKENMEAEILSLKHYSRELQKKLVKLLKEKDILWKRNDHLYHLQKVKIDDRWINDSEVSNCLACKKIFSFVLRKHHCRICGRIFCYSCANNWLVTASSRKKIRACNECFVQHMEIKKVVRRGSDVPHVDDDSEDETEKDNCDLSFLHASRSSFTSEIPSSMSNSIISLPTSQKCNTSRFASAPDLRYVYKPNEFASCSVSLAEEKLENEEEKLQVTNGDVSVDLEHVAEKNLNEFDLKQSNENIPNILEEISVDNLVESDCSLNGKLVVLPGNSSNLHLFCQICPVVLKWSFASDYQTVPFTITYEGENCDKNSTVFYESSENMQDQMELSLTGHYIFHFNNIIRDTGIEIEYVLTAMHPS